MVPTTHGVLRRLTFMTSFSTTASLTRPTLSDRIVQTHGKMEYLLFDQDGKLRSGWRATIFLFSFIFVALLLAALAHIGLTTFQIHATPKSSISLVTNAVLSLAPALLLGWLYGHLFEKLPFRALGASLTKGWLAHWLFGLILGAITLSIAVIIGYVFGGLRFELNAAAGMSTILRSLAISFLVFGLASAFEEALFRGYILQTFARSGLAWLAILLTSVFFGAVHLGNPNANLISIANTVLAGVWFSVAYLKTSDLWFVWGLHLMWNWMQGSFFGIEVSGLTEITASPLLREIDTGPSWLTGQTYGIEGGIACTIALVFSIGAIYFLPVLKPDEELLELTSPKSNKVRSNDHQGPTN
jgi:membrane protease YdiL (CAAX protease family)